MQEAVSIWYVTALKRFVVVDNQLRSGLVRCPTEIVI